MLTFTVPLEEGFDENTREFTVIRGFELELEHSLVTLSKWESKWEKPFLGKDEKTSEEALDYIKIMTLTPNVPEEVWEKLPDRFFAMINSYINSKQTATWFSDPPNQRPSRETITSELIYYWLVSYNIPFEVQYWHLNKLLTLIKICNVKNAPEKKMGRREQAEMQRQLNAQRRAQLNSRG